ncbi:nitroreductase family protein [Leptolinea tardivitalis]|uniref:NADH dehydrogenase n=1 Tax=Leptolinea tardivitalis TaxID=229920 RepID=A0A0P6WVX3_9CHLR|nr:nitroreductase family protein [Leptolinea tardivitalis]KPL70651.1 NADH dehydrogenase [Leptolinea tardivitalis]GAP22278.1 nitroreductase [Leptolinea tardivitalis]
MDVLEAILSRRSIRKYTDEPVTDQEIDMILQAAMAAPSSGNARPWHFIVIRNHETLDEIARVHPYAGMLPQAKVAILVCADEKLENHPGRWPQDCAAATENILLAAHAQGLGAVWIGLHPESERMAVAKKLFGLPDSVHALSLVAIGRPNEKKLPPHRFKPERIHIERW